jgi:hypothetical protein
MIGFFNPGSGSQMIDHNTDSILALNVFKPGAKNLQIAGAGSDG